jgi:hypothetical protein
MGDVEIGEDAGGGGHDVPIALAPHDDGNCGRFGHGEEDIAEGA